jgi:hypothetical protein
VEGQSFNFVRHRIFPSVVACGASLEAELQG